MRPIFFFLAYTRYVVVLLAILSENLSLPALVVLPEATLTHLLPDLRCNSIGRDLVGGSDPVMVSASPAMPLVTFDVIVPLAAAAPGIALRPRHNASTPTSSARRAADGAAADTDPPEGDRAASVCASVATDPSDRSMAARGSAGAQSHRLLDKGAQPGSLWQAHSAMTGKVTAELKFVLWQKMFTARHETRVQNHRILALFPSARPSGRPG